MTKYCNGHPVVVDVFCHNNNTVLYTRSDTRVELGVDGNYYLHNAYSGYICRDFDNVRFHRKLKIYSCESHGCYVKCNGVRCYVNGMLNKNQYENITGTKIKYLKDI